MIRAPFRRSNGITMYRCAVWVLTGEMDNVEASVTAQAGRTGLACSVKGNERVGNQATRGRRACATPGPATLAGACLGALSGST